MAVTQEILPVGDGCFDEVHRSDDGKLWVPAGRELVTRNLMREVDALRGHVKWLEHELRIERSKTDCLLEAHMSKAAHRSDLSDELDQARAELVRLRSAVATAKTATKGGV